eukprot:SAG31_NODE_2013_length_6665_cov_2.751295_6_plen_74_part_00
MPNDDRVAWSRLQVLSIYQLNTFTEIYTNMQDGALFSQMHDTYASVEMNDAFWLVCIPLHCTVLLYLTGGPAS